MSFNALFINTKIKSKFEKSWNFSINLFSISLNLSFSLQSIEKFMFLSLFCKVNLKSFIFFFELSQFLFYSFCAFNSFISSSNFFSVSKRFFQFLNLFFSTKIKFHFTLMKFSFSLSIKSQRVPLYEHLKQIFLCSVWLSI